MIKKNDYWKYILLIIVIMIMLFPLLWILLQSFKNYFDTIAVPPKFFFRPILDNYIEVLKTTGFGKAFLDSLIVSICSVVASLFVGVPFAYILARYEFKGKNDIGFFILSTKFLPAIVIIIPLIKIFSLFKMIDTYIGLILAHILISLALVVWISRGFFIGIPKEIEEAARIDGSTNWRTFTKIALPLSLPGIASVAILGFLFSWNDLIFGLTLASINVKTLPVFMSSAFVGYLAVSWGPLSAAGVLAIIPPIVFIAIVQKDIVRGLTFGAIK